MNRLILIGNGFDLAHNLKTGYENFLHWYLENVIKDFYSKRHYQDLLIELQFSLQSIYNKLDKMDTLEEVIDAINILTAPSNPNLSTNFLSPYLIEIINRKYKNWIDLENHYFSYLSRLVKSSDRDLSSIVHLNKQFDYLKSKLETYLNKVCSVKPSQSEAKYNYLSDEVKDCQLIYPESKILNKKIENIYILNFNYTNTFNVYANCLNEKTPTSINHIHGELNSGENPIIFGFGDEHNEQYKSFENRKNNALFEHIKSFKYLKTSNYHDLIRFINSNQFQVCIKGHSCGLSDRTMLKEIFEHENCVSIMIYYHKWGSEDNQNDYVNKTYEISRHFTDKGLMRKKIVSFNNSRPLH